MKTTLYFSEQVEAGEYPYEELKDSLEVLKLKVNGENRTISFESLDISYRLRYRGSLKKYVLAFGLDRPDGQLTVSETTKRYNVLCKFIDLLPEKIKGGNLTFKQEEMNDNIDMGKWEIKDPYTSQEVSIFDNYNLAKLKEHYKDKIQLKPLFFVLNDSQNTSKIMNTLRIFFSDRGEEIKTQLSLVRDSVNNRSDKENIFILILYTGELIEEYIRLKKFFLQNNIPSQFLNMDDKEFFFKTKNLIPEILTKAFCYPFKFPDNLSTVDGYICLNDVYDENHPLFGINITYNSENNLFQNKIKVYSDIKYESSRFSLKLTERNIDLLIEKITTLSPELRGKKINIYLTKYWKYDNLKLLKEKLEKKDIGVNKIFNISFFSDKFVFKGLDSLEQTKVPYLIKDKYVAYIQPNTKIGLFGSLFPISLELSLWDARQKITPEDVEEYVWLIKRRVYRLQYIDMLRYPEFLKYSKKIRDLNLSNNDLSQLTFNGDLLI